MTADDFRGWMLEMGWTIQQASYHLGKSIETIRRYRLEGVPAREATVIWLACEALRAGLRRAA